jgi:outer membrane receptor protein involved in Fe transport
VIIKLKSVSKVESPEHFKGNIVNVKALYSTAFRAPSMMELYLKHPTLKGTPTLKPEKIRTVDLGANIQTDKVSLSINNYYSQISNNISLEQKPIPPIYYQNFKVPTTIFGMEIEGKLFITKELMLTGSGLYQKNSTGDSAGNMMPVPEASAKGGISYSKYGLTASLFNIYEGKLDKRYNATFNKTRKAFDPLNLNIRYEFDKVFNWKTPQFAVHFDFYNLLDDEIWLPATGQFNNYTLPQIEGRSTYFGIDVGF